MPAKEILCNVCGAKNTPDNKFCSNCGSPMMSPKTGVANPSNTNVPPVADQQIHEPGDYKLPKKPETKPQRASTTKRVLSQGCVIGFGAVTVVLCAVVTVLVYTAVFNGANKTGQGATSSGPANTTDPSSPSTQDDQGGLIEITTLTPASQTFEGVWIENYGQASQSGGMATSAAAVLFQDGTAYFGIFGDSATDLYLGTSGAGIPGGSPFELTPNSLIIYTPDGTPIEYMRDGTTWWAGDSVFTPDGGADGGRLVNK